MASARAIDQADWYNYARQLAMVQGATFALPFAGDALVVAYRPARVVAPPADWPAVYSLGQPLAFPAGDPQALFVLSLYQSVGGEVEDAQRRPTLQPELLSQVLAGDGGWGAAWDFPLLAVAVRDQRSGLAGLPRWAGQCAGNLGVSAISPICRRIQPPSPLPRLDDSPLTLATGWGWAVADPNPERRALFDQAG